MPSRSSSANINTNRTLVGMERMERKAMGRKLDLVFYRQLFEYGCYECGRREYQAKKLLHGSKIAKVLKDMLYSLYQRTPGSLRELALAGLLLFVGRVCSISHKRNLDLAEETDAICTALLPILAAVYKSIVMMENTNKLAKQKLVDIDLDLDLDIDQCKTIS
ncbi:hypothetical protein PHYBLDRAFT_150991 [Phycomyces blakesleeanus NRRL 1555(-)]|uniref:Uncharacterized protein n=2 Tax=Phycomyces blakesleeanus TaxID=4837 RepID=A0A167KED8_PHYB8|nr:hypothetical protein PHYBLDRAFT_150991 [Phycomyces blakesleeanus NRRL 1555(-)]OAD67905.1 hypothetical protein PHYBLDRAFT_150991 [Phycomyces blakesleeanus NRRL 1555(-)]|eukprot:XP_018285945.1 hypothetical protein PHYBLDRAFT_150991 [Phycomyces blakesleeanus NRRL 1555(-)]